eukprot:5593639-Amphidinium_carterae.1
MPRRRLEPQFCLSTGMQECEKWTGTSIPELVSDTLAGRLNNVSSDWNLAWLCRSNQHFPLPGRP